MASLKDNLRGIPAMTAVNSAILRNEIQIKLAAERVPNGTIIRPRGQLSSF